MIISGLLLALKAIFFQLIASVGVKFALERLLFLVAEQIVKSTKTESDEKFLAEIKELYFKHEKKL